LLKKKIKSFIQQLSSEKDTNLDNSKVNSETEKELIEYNKPAGEIHKLLKYLSRTIPDVNYLLDVGAHTTEWIRNAMRHFPGSKAYLIEPLNEMEIHLKKFCEDFPGSKYFLNGAGEKEDTLLLTLNDVLEGANFLGNENKNLQIKDKQRKVKILTIDSLLEKNEIEMPGIVKLDVQGFELNVLKGASGLFGWTEVFIVEASMFEFMQGVPLFSEVISFMADRGYVVYDFSGFLRRPYDGALGQMDVCFVKKEGIFRNSNNWYKPVSK
jgi:FkbM family methyltransferase